METSQSLASELVDPRLHTGYGSLNLRVPTSENHSVRNQSHEAFLRKESKKRIKAAHNGWLLEGKEAVDSSRQNYQEIFKKSSPLSSGASSSSSASAIAKLCGKTVD